MAGRVEDERGHEEEEAVAEHPRPREGVEDDADDGERLLGHGEDVNWVVFGVGKS